MIGFSPFLVYDAPFSRMRVFYWLYFLCVRCHSGSGRIGQDRAGSGGLMGDPSVEPLPFDNMAAMASAGDGIACVIGFDVPENIIGAANFATYGFNAHFHPHRRRCFMGDFDEASQRTIAGFDKGGQGVGAAPFDQGDHETGGEHPGHFLKFGAFGVKIGHGFIIAHDINQAVAFSQSGAETFVSCFLLIFRGVGLEKKYTRRYRGHQRIG